MTRLLCVLLTVLLAPACGREPSASSRTGSAPIKQDEVCALLTAADVQAVVGVAPAAPRYEQSQCIWASADGSEEHLVQLMAVPAGYRSYDDVAQAFRETMDGADPASAMHPIEGIEAPGRFAIGFNEMPMVQIYTDTTMIQVATFGREERHALDLAKRAASRLK